MRAMLKPVESVGKTTKGCFKPDAGRLRFIDRICEEPTVFGRFTPSAEPDAVAFTQSFVKPVTANILDGSVKRKASGSNTASRSFLP
jgi:hypothetical protein